MLLAVAFACLAIAAAACYGWGSLLRRLLRLTGGNRVLTVGLGLAAVNAVGGVVNLFRIAYPSMLAAILAAGVLMSAVDAWRFLRSRRRTSANLLSTRRPWRYCIVLIAMAAVYSIETAIPSENFNRGDDCCKYLVHPVRMLQTGTLESGGLNTLGLTTFGGGAFLDAFAVMALPLDYINGVDEIFGFVVCLALLASLTIEEPGSALIAVLSMVLMVELPPQTVNITPTYLSAALMLTVIGLTTDRREQIRGRPLTIGMAVGFVYSAAISQKFTFLLIFALYVPLTIMSRAAMRRETWRSTLSFGVACVAGCAIGALPWLLLFFPNYVAVLRGAPIVLANSFSATDSVNLIGIADGGRFFYPLMYTLPVAAALITSFMAAAFQQKSDRFVAASLAATSLTAAIAFLFLLYVCAARLYGVKESYRYFAACAIGFLPAVLALSSLGIRDEKGRVAGWIAGSVSLLIPVVLFAPVTFHRLLLPVTARSTDRSDTNDTSDNGSYLHDLLSGSFQAQVREAQNAIPAGAEFVAWTGGSFQLDFARNRIIDIDAAGLGSPWARWPNSPYLLWQCGGYNAQVYVPGRDISPTGADRQREEALAYLLTRRLAQIVVDPLIVYRSERFVVLKLDPLAEEWLTFASLAGRSDNPEAFSRFRAARLGPRPE